METVYTVVGAGAVGLAVAAELAPRGPVLILERNLGIGQGTSGRSSEVVHAGLYYRPGSLRARLCVEGRAAIERFGKEQRFAYRRVGKLLVARTDAERQTLEELRLRAMQNGVKDLMPLTRSAIRKLEPDVQAHSGLLSPSTGIFDSHGLLRFLLARAESRGAQLALGCTVSSIEQLEGGFSVNILQNDTEQHLRTRYLINAAGLHADTIAACAGMDLDALDLRLRWIRGEYFSLAPSCPIRVRRLVYPVPGTKGHLGLHLTIDMADRLRLGPSVELSAADQQRQEVFSQDSRQLPKFLRAARGYLPALEEQHLAPGGAGLRPRLPSPGEEQRDFYLREESDRGLPGLVNCIGIDSPGLTAAPAIGRHVAGLLPG